MIPEQKLLDHLHEIEKEIRGSIMDRYVKEQKVSVIEWIRQDIISGYLSAPPSGEGRGWIAVSERLPKTFEAVLVYQGDASSNDRLAWVDHSGDWYWCNLASRSPKCNPSLWMPIPPVPEKSEAPNE